MDDEKDAFTLSFGRTVLLGHMLESMLRLHLFECGQYGVANATRRSWKKIKSVTLENAIKELRILQPNAIRFCDALDDLRRIRNDLIHDFFRTLHSDLDSLEGRDQIHAMINRVISQQVRFLSVLQEFHGKFLKAVVELDPTRVLVDGYEDDHSLPIGTTAQSEIQKRLEVIEAYDFGQPISFQVNLTE